MTITKKRSVGWLSQHLPTSNNHFRNKCIRLAQKSFTTEMKQMHVMNTSCINYKTMDHWHLYYA